MRVTYDIDESKQLAEKVSIGPEIVVPEQDPYVQFSDTSIAHGLTKIMFSIYKNETTKVISVDMASYMDGIPIL